MIPYVVASIIVVAPIPPPQGSPPSAGTSYRYCGLYCVHAAASALQVPSDFAKLLSSQYMNGSHGSTAADLQNAARAVGLNARVRSGMTLAHLQHASSPVILHVRTAGSGRQFVHWVLFLGFKGDRIQLYDPPKTEATLAADELLALWDGTGVVVGTGGNDELAPTLIPVPAIAATLLTGLAIMLAAACSRRWALPAIPLAALASCMAWQILSTPSFLHSQSGVALLAASHLTHRSPEVDTARVQELLDDRSATLIDARLEYQYRAGHIPGATNIPALLGIPALLEALAAIPKDRPIVVYCSNRNCNWSDMIANHFVQRGFRRVLIYRDGYDAWSTRPAVAPASGGPSS